jgi:hypothetical protein
VTALAGLDVRDPRYGRAVARADGLIPAVTWLTDAVAGGALVCGPSGHAVVPAGVARTAQRVWLGNVPADRAAGQETTLRTLRLDGEDLIALRHRPAAAGPEPPCPWPDWIFGLAWVRLGVSEALLDRCLTYLRNRKTGETPLLLQQMVRGSVAEAVGGHLEIRAVLDGSAAAGRPAVALADLHRQITVTDRGLSRLLGAAGFLADGPGQSAYLSALLSDAYLGEVPA